MNNLIIYEAKPSHEISILFFIIILIFIIVLIFGITLCIKNREARVIDKIGPFVVDAILLFIIICIVITSFDSKNKVWNQYSKGNYLVAEGSIANYEEVKGISNEDIKYDSFSIAKTEFHVPGFTTIWGYPLRQVDGGVLKNGLKVKIYYVPYKFENVIMKLELIENQ